MSSTGVQGLWDRVTGGGFPLRLSVLDGARSFDVRAEAGVLHVAATDGVSAAAGIHRYLAEACGVRVTWGATLPLRLDKLPDTAPIRATARAGEFYHLNFCTFGYSTAYWDWPEWEREIDWMALHGVTMPLQLVGHEAVLGLAYSRLGMSEDEIRSFLGGPGYLPWLYMGCLDSFAGPLPAGWARRHLDLGRRILRRQRDLGMTPVLPAFTGHVPARLAPAGARTRLWQGLRTTVVAPGDPLFRRLTAEIVTAQRELLGTDHLYAADPFIEMVPADVDDGAGYPAEVAAAIVDGLRAGDADARWVLQSWPFSYQGDYWTRERVHRFLDGIPRDRVLILDLWGEADPQWSRLDGYAGRPWIFTGLLNFGGRSEPIADLESTARNLEAALAADHPPAGLGLTMEAIHNNPAFFELITDRAWTGHPAGLDEWIRDFGRRRYAAESPAAGEAWSALRRSVLNADARSIFPERFIAMAVRRPDYTRLLDPGSTVPDDVRAALHYRPADLLEAIEALLAAPDCDAARDDLALACVALLLRVIDHRFVALLGRAGRPEAFLDTFTDLDDLVATRPSMRLETWVAAARRWADDPEGRRVLEDNARRVLTVWNTSDDPRLDDYSARVWSGLVGGYYRRRWELWLRFLPQALDPDRRAASQQALDAELRRLAEEFIAAGPPAVTGAHSDVRAAARHVLDRYGDEFRALTPRVRPGRFPAGRSTEDRDPRTVDIDLWPSDRIVDALLAEDATAIAAARQAAPVLADAVDRALERTSRGGRVHYFGAGASGRLSVLDASEATPTFGTPPGFFTAHFPGGGAAVLDSSLDHEDAESSGYADAAGLTADDVVVGLTASGTTPYVAGALTRACELGALTVLITCNDDSPLAADLRVIAPTGPEAITGSTRLKAGTATKALLNAFSTALMVRSGRTYSNLMVNLVATNEKLHSRAVRILETAAGIGHPESTAALARSDGDLPLALLHALSAHPVEDCRRALRDAGSVRAALTVLGARDAR